MTYEMVGQLILISWTIMWYLLAIFAIIYFIQVAIGGYQVWRDKDNERLW